MNWRAARKPRLVHDFSLPAGLADIRIPMVLVHPGGFPVDAYRRLATVLSPDFDLYVVDMDGMPEYFRAAFNGGHSTLSLDDMVEQIRTGLAEHGLPGRAEWLLAGWEFGGVAAYALSKQLPEDQRPQGLLLLDSVAPVPRFTRTDDEQPTEILLPWFASHLAAKRGRELALPATLFDGCDEDTGLPMVLDRAVAAGVLSAQMTLPGLRKVFRSYADSMRRNVRLARRYQAGHTVVPLTVLRADTGPFEIPTALGWERVADDVPVLWCSADHYSMFLQPLAVSTIGDAAGHAYRRSSPSPQPSSDTAQIA